MNNEYLMLREEIMYNQKVENSSVQFAYTMVATLWAAALAQIGNEWIVFISLVLIIPISLRVWYSRQSMAFLAAYMSVFLEGKENFNWETRHCQFYNRFGRSKSEKMVYYWSRLDFTFLSTAGTVLFWTLRNWEFKIMGNIKYAILILFLQILIIGIELFLCYKYTNISKLKEKKLRDWKLLKAEISDEAMVNVSEHLHNK